MSRLAQWFSSNLHSEHTKSFINCIRKIFYLHNKLITNPSECLLRAGPIAHGNVNRNVNRFSKTYKKANELFEPNIHFLEARLVATRLFVFVILLVVQLAYFSYRRTVTRTEILLLARRSKADDVVLSVSIGFGRDDPERVGVFDLFLDHRRSFILKRQCNFKPRSQWDMK